MQPTISIGFGGQWKRLRGLYDEYPSQFWILVLGTFIDRLGGALLFPFFSLYVTRKFNVGMTQVGILFGLFSISSLVSSFFGGALTDRLGRKGILIFGLVMSALSSLLMGVIDSIGLFILVAMMVGLLADVGFPAQQAMVADLLPEEKRAQGFGILRIVVNLSVTIGPMVGGLLAAKSYLLLFVCDAVASLITAGIVFLALKETMRARAAEEAEPTIAQTFRGYLDVLRDSAFSWFLVASILMVLVYMQMNTTLAVYLRDVHGVTERGFGYILSLNAAMVVLFQFPITRWIGRYRPMNVMVAGTLLYAIGFGLYGLVSAYVLFLGAMAIITIGEMLVSPVSQAIVSRLAPEDMRGRYMATYGFSWVIPSAIGPLAAGLVMDHGDPHWVWFGAILVGLVAAAAFYRLEWQVSGSRWTAIEARLHIMQQLEEGEISAQEAASLLGQVGEGRWARLAPAAVSREQRHLRIRVSDLGTGATQSELRLPIGLVNTILHTGGRLSAELDSLDPRKLRALISRSVDTNRTTSMQAGGDRQVEVSVE